MLGDLIGQILGAQIGVISKELEQSAITLPSTHLHEHLAFASYGNRNTNIKRKKEKVLYLSNCEKDRVIILINMSS